MAGTTGAFQSPPTKIRDRPNFHNIRRAAVKRAADSRGRMRSATLVPRPVGPASPVLREEEVMAKKVKDATDGAQKASEPKKSDEKIGKRGSALSLKVLEQAEANTREAFAALRAAAAAGSPAQVAKIQSDYLRDQGARALAHAREIGDLIMRFGGEAAGAGKKR